jgi:ketosteroid isomerase-like protein
MPQENVEVVRRAFALAPSESFLSLCHSEIEWDMSPLMPEPRVYYGHYGVREVWRSWAGTWDGFEFEMERAVDAGGDLVVVEVKNVAQGRASGVPVEDHFGQVWTVKDGPNHAVDRLPELR